MKVYSDILPFGDRVLITIDGVEHILLDQHCMRTGCDCTETYIELSPILPDGNLIEHAGTISLGYASRRWQLVADNASPRILHAAFVDTGSCRPFMATAGNDTWRPSERRR